MRRGRATLAAAALLGAVVVVFYPLLGAGFVFWDDRALFTDNADVRLFRLGRFFTDLSPGGYFPLVRVSLALDHLAFGYEAGLSHAVNVGLHVLNVALVYRVARAVFGLEGRLAYVVAALFAVHPIHVEAVAWISGGRKDLLCTAAYLGAMLALARGREGWAFASAVTALSCKALAVTLAPWGFGAGHRRWALTLLPVCLAIGVVEILAQRTGLRLATEGADWTAALTRPLAALGFAVSRLVWPRDLAVYYDRRQLHFDVFDALILIAVAFLVVQAFRRRDRPRLAAAGFFLLTLAPTLKVLPFGQDSVFNDRYLYLPSVGALAFLVTSVNVLGRRIRTRMIAWSAPLLALGIHAHAQTRVWLSQETLWTNVAQRFPGSRKVAANLSLFYIQEGLNEKALPFAYRAVNDEPADLEARSNLGVLLTRLNRLEDARRVLTEALALAPGQPWLLNNLGWVELAAGRKAAARSCFEEALRVAPEFAPAREGLARANAP